MPIAQVTTDVRSAQRIRRVAAGIGIPRGLLDDLAQEAWVRATEYARAHDLRVEDLSTTELRHRCFEARRAVLPRRNEVCVEEVADIVDEVHEDALDTLLRVEHVRKRCADVTRVRWVLRTHPTLQLTPTQATMWRAACADPRGRWRAALARERGVTRQDIAKITGVARRKAVAAADLVRCWDGEVLPFFMHYGTSWGNAPVTRLLLSILRPTSGWAVPPTMRRASAALASEMVAHAHRIFAGERRALRDGRANPQALCAGYHLLTTAAHAIRGGAALPVAAFDLGATPSTSWILSRFQLRATQLASPSARDAHRDFLREVAVRPLAEGRQFATYALAYFGGTREDTTARYLASDGQATVERYDLAPVIGEAYGNTREELYRGNLAWREINLLRLAVVHAYYPADLHQLPARSRNALVSVCRGVRRSVDPVVTRCADRLLAAMA